MSKKQNELVWNTVAVETMPKAQQTAYAEFKALQDKANKARDAFEASFLTLAQAKGHCPKDRKLLFGYRFGRLAVALAPEDDGEAKTKGKNLLSF